MNLDKLGIAIQTEKKQCFWKGKQASVKESFENILKQEFTNVISDAPKFDCFLKKRFL